MSPVFSQEFAPDTQSQPSVLLPLHSEAGTPETGKKVRASFTALGLALSLGAAGSLVSSAEAADSLQLAALPSIAGEASTLPSFGSTRPEGTAASYHTVADGETIWDIARQHGLSVDEIKAANSIGEGQVIQAGQVLKVPTIAVNAAALAEGPEFEVSDDLVEPSVSDETLAAPVVAWSANEVAVDEAPSEAETASEPLSAVVDPTLEATASDSEAEVAVSAAAPRSLPVPKASSFNEQVPLALLPETESQVESVQQLAEQLTAANEVAEKNKIAAVIAEDQFEGSTARIAGFTHRVGSGETIWSIARSYGLDPDSLQHINQIDNPRLIAPGDELTIPADESVELTQAPDYERLSRRQLGSEQQMAAIAPVLETPAEAYDSFEPSLTDEPTPATPSTTANEDVRAKAIAVAVGDPFVENMLSDVATATQSQVGGTATIAARQASNSSEDLVSEAREYSEIAIAVEDNSSSDEIALNPQFVNDAEAEPAGIETNDEAASLLAAAPLGSEVYSPMVESPTGRVVSPEMPVMPGQDAYLPEAPNRFEGYMWPAQGVLTSGYGWRWGRMHRGVDIAGPVGTPIYAAAPGVVVTSGWNSGGYGNLVDIRHPDGSLTRYAHNSRLMVSPGQQVRQGQQIAEMGSTGYSTGPHLHFEVHVPNQGTVNPIAMLPGR